jgi:type IV pilus assembly protein PilA
MKFNNTKSKQQPGFTLLEMLAVIAILAILSALAIPSYQGRIVRKQIEAGISLADIAKRPIAASWAAAQVLPADNVAAGLPVPDKIVSNFVSALSVQDGAINLTFGNRANSAIKGKVLTLRPAVVADAPIVPVEWVCGKAEPPAKMTVKGINQTTVPDGYLPLSCHALGK